MRDGDGTMPLIEHLTALRKVLVVSAYIIAISIVLCWLFAARKRRWALFNIII